MWNCLSCLALFWINIRTQCILFLFLKFFLNKISYSVLLFQFSICNSCTHCPAYKKTYKISVGTSDVFIYGYALRFYRPTLLFLVPFHERYARILLSKYISIKYIISYICIINNDWIIWFVLTENKSQIRFIIIMNWIKKVWT